MKLNWRCSDENGNEADKSTTLTRWDRHLQAPAGTSRTLCHGKKPPRQVPARVPCAVVRAGQAPGAAVVTRAIKRRTHSSAAPDSLWTYAAVTLYLLSGGSAEHGGGSGGHPDQRLAGTGVRRLSSAQLRRVCHPGTARDLRHQRPG